MYIEEYQISHSSSSRTCSSNGVQNFWSCGQSRRDYWKAVDFIDFQIFGRRNVRSTWSTSFGDRETFQYRLVLPNDFINQVVDFRRLPNRTTRSSSLPAVITSQLGIGQSTVNINLLIKIHQPLKAGLTDMDLKIFLLFSNPASQKVELRCMTYKSDYNVSSGFSQQSAWSRVELEKRNISVHISQPSF